MPICAGDRTAAEVYAPCEAGLASWRAAAINNTKCLRLHAKRAFASEQLTQPVASASEAAHLARVAPQLQPGGAAVNVSVWRRSGLIILVVSAFVTMAFRGIDLARELRHADDIQATAAQSSRRLLNGTDPVLAAVSFQRTDYYLERPKIVGGPGCNKCGSAAAAATGCQRFLFGQCSWPTVEIAQLHCASWAQCGGFVCQNSRSDCQARGKGREAEMALTRAGFSLARSHDWDFSEVVDADTDTSTVQASGDAEAWLSAENTVSFVCPDRAVDPACDMGAATWLKTPDYHLESFADYSKRFAVVVMARLAMQPLWASCALHGAVLLLTFSGCVSLAVALLRWDHYAKSRQKVLLGWLLIFMGPALVSVVPLRIFVDWSAGSSALSDYKAMFQEHFNIDAAEAAITAACDAAAGDGSASSDDRGLVTGAIDEVCGTIDDQLPPGLRIHHEWEATVGCWFAQGTIRRTLVDDTYDFAPVHVACDEARELKASEDDANALEKVQEACAVYMDLSSAKPGGNAGRMISQAESFTDKVLMSAELMLGATHALRAFKLLLPAALSIGPGLLRGSVKVKTFIPQSSIPGMFITLLPWLYTPLVWTLYNIAFQLVGDLYMLAGLFFLAFGPMIYYLIGVRMQVTLPMTTEKIVRWLWWISLQGKLISLLAYLALGYWALFVEDTKNTVLETLRTMEIADVSVPTLVGIACNTITSFLLTTLAATDFMIGETADQRELENVLVNGFGGAKTKLRIMKTLVDPTKCSCFGVNCCCCFDKSDANETKQEVTVLQDVLKDRNDVLDEMRAALRPSDRSEEKGLSYVHERSTANDRRPPPQDKKLSWCSRRYRQLPAGKSAAQGSRANVQDGSNPAPAPATPTDSKAKACARSCCTGLWVTLKHLPVHFSRAMESSKLLEDIVSTEEARHLTAVTGIHKGRTANLMVWRRSALVATVALSSVAAGWSIAALGSDYIDLTELRELSLSTSRRLVNGMNAADIEWSYDVAAGISTAPVILGGPECQTAPGLAGQCSWPVAEAAKYCSTWAKCGAYVCSSQRDELSLCQARGHSPTGAVTEAASDGAALETFVKREAVVEEGFADYTKRVVLVGLARLRLGSAVAAWWAQAIIVGCVVMSLIMSILALNHWDSYVRSRRHVAVAWFLTFMGPCLVSLLPLRLFINAQGLADALADYVAETRLEYSIEQQLIASLELCQAIVNGEHDTEYNESKERLEAAVEDVCVAVESFVPRVIDWSYHQSINVPCVVDVDIDIDEYHDFRPVHEGCARARAALQSDSAAGALTEIKSSCLDYIELVGTGGNAFELMEMVEQYIDKATTAGEVVFSFLQAVASFRILVPAAIAVAPAVIRGALKVKTIVPQSSIPGMFICMLPWVYCPLVWCFTSMLFQMVGSPTVLVGLILLAYSPMVYFVVGRWKRITMPMSNAVVLSVLRWIEGYHTILATGAYVTLIWGLVRTDLGALAAIFEDWDIELLGKWPVLVSIIFSAAAKLILTTLAGFDFIISQIVEQRRCELPRGSIYVPREVGGGSQPDQGKRAAADRAAAADDGQASMFRQRDERLDDMCALFPSPFDEPKAQPHAAAATARP
jgi:hypothetical protein